MLVRGRSPAAMAYSKVSAFDARPSNAFSYLLSPILRTSSDLDTPTDIYWRRTNYCTYYRTARTTDFTDYGLCGSEKCIEGLELRLDLYYILNAGQLMYSTLVMSAAGQRRFKDFVVSTYYEARTSHRRFNYPCSCVEELVHTDSFCLRRVNTDFENT